MLSVIDIKQFEIVNVNNFNQYKKGIFRNEKTIIRNYIVEKFFYYNTNTKTLIV